MHLGLEGWKKDNEMIKSFSIRGIPFVFLVDKQGIINFKGHPSEIDLEKRMTELLEKEGKPQGSKETHSE